MEQAAEILKHVEQPLQLAAVALLALYGITKALIATNRWTPSDRIVTLFLNRAFTLGLLALVLAVGGPLLARAVDSDDLIDGSVYGDDNAAIRNATVSAPPLGARPVNYDGSFELRVPNHRKRDRYEITASAEGFKSETRTVDQAHLRSVDFKLLAQPDHIVRHIAPDIVVGQFYGLPVVVVSMQVKGVNSQTWLRDVTAQLSNERFNLTITPKFFTTIGTMGPYLPVTGWVPIEPNVSLTIRFVLAPDADFSAMNQSVARLPEYDARLPCAASGNGNTVPLTDRAFDLVEAFARSKFIWAEGEWTLHLKVTAENQQDSFDKTFRLSAADVENLRNSTALLKSCRSYFNQFPLAQDGAIANYLPR